MKKILYALLVCTSIVLAQTYQYEKVQLSPRTFYGFEQTVYVDGSIKGDLQIQKLWEKLLIQTKTVDNKIYVVYEECNSKTCKYFVGTKENLRVQGSVAKHILTDTYKKICHTYEQKSDLHKAYKTLLQQTKGYNNKRIIEVHPFDQLTHKSYVMDIYLSVKK